MSRPAHASRVTTPCALRGLGAAFLAFAAATGAQAEKLVVIRSTAQGGYAARRITDGQLKTESYVFMPGHFFAGLTHDRALEKMPFEALARVLAQDLQARKFLPARNAGEADLLLVVHWGVTTKVEKDYDLHLRDFDSLRRVSESYADALATEAAAAADGNMMPTVMTMRGELEAQHAHEQLNLLSNQRSGHITHENNAELLGVQAALRKEQGSIMYTERYRTLHAMTQEERYFMIVMAYDMPALLQTGSMRRLWTARLSIRAAGVNFPQAVGRMSQAAADYFGTEQPDVVFQRPGERKATVEIGEITVIGTSGP
ncbi:MAG TPA: hypothetical protein VEB66_04300 [Opitutaceae bacterium]|nr:hypothetical protein [Opitutaceae bacterium]